MKVACLNQCYLFTVDYSKIESPKPRWRPFGFFPINKFQANGRSLYHQEPVGMQSVFREERVRFFTRLYDDSYSE